MIPLGTIAAFGLYLVRTSALLLATPLLGNGAAFSGYKVALVAAVSLALYGATGEPLTEAIGPVEYALFCMREALIGLSLAFVLQAVVIAVRVGGELIGHEMAFNMSSQVDPSTGINTPLITRMYEAFFFLGLLAVDGHHLILRALSETFLSAPIGTVDFSEGIIPYLIDFFGELFRAGITFAAPVMVVLLLVSILIGLLARAVPQMNVLEVGFTLRISAALIALFLFAPLLAPALRVLYERLDTGLVGFLEVL
ncbi:MAG: flagellar biosynthetic protein FliR [Planctomycetota bacterium]|nr:flagellar biosynthetic protein FliR [Planctomycetota bacterium]